MASLAWTVWVGEREREGKRMGVRRMGIDDETGNKKGNKVFSRPN